MVRGFYTAASGLVTQERRLNAISNNLSNFSTVGYKKDGVTLRTFGEHMSVRMNAYQNKGTVEIGPGVFMQTVDQEYTDYASGGFEQTNRPMDMAISGTGFFVVADEEGNEYLTRDGQFSLDEEGYLVLPGYGRVQGQDGEIMIGTSEFEVGTNGSIYRIPVDPEEDIELVDRLIVAQPEDYDAMNKAANGMFVTEDYDVGAEIDGSYAIRQGHLERSNVDATQEMTEMMAAQRALQSCSQIVKMYDELTEQANTRIARMQ